MSNAKTSSSGARLARPWRPRLALEGRTLCLALALALALCAAPWMYLFYSTELQSGRQARPAGTSGSPDRAGAVENISGAAGRLELTDIVIAPPLEYVQLPTDARMDAAWYFRNTTAERFQEFLGQLPLDEISRRQLLAEAKWDEAHAGFVITPPPDLIWRLTPDARGLLYHALSQDPLNQVQSNAFRFSGTREQWLGQAGLEPETLKLVDRLLYRHKGSLFLSDIDSLLPRLKPHEQTRLLKAVSGQRTMVVRLRVGPEDDLPELVDYWGRGKRAKDIRPILESLGKAPGGGTIDVAHLLPQFARMRIYTYAVPCYQDEPCLRQNCHWTAMNFFSREPDDRYSEVKEALAEIRANYHPVFRNFKLGDVVIFADETGAVFHSAVHIADDVLFTKNGSNFSLPWMYMRLEQMKEFYPRTTQVHVSYYRHRSM
jgi:hypothetical protein